MLSGWSLKRRPAPDSGRLQRHVVYAPGCTDGLVACPTGMVRPIDWPPGSVGRLRVPATQSREAETDGTVNVEPYVTMRGGLSPAAHGNQCLITRPEQTSTRRFSVLSCVVTLMSLALPNMSRVVALAASDAKLGPFSLWAYTW